MGFTWLRDKLGKWLEDLSWRTKDAAILEYIRDHPQCTGGQIALACGISRTVVYLRLNELEDDDRVFGEEEPMEKGVIKLPRRLYTLAEQV